MSRVLDVTMFHWELDLLELRMRELWDVVDHFVVTESRCDHRGRPRELRLPDPRFDWAREKLVVHAADPPEGARSSWDYERHHRRESIRAVEALDPRPDDLLLVSDLDELFRASAVANLVGQPGVYTMHMPMYYFYVNLYVHDWFMPTALTYEYATDPDRIRNCGGYVIRDAGWHFGYLGSEQDILYKLQTFAHDEYDTPEFASLENIRRALAERTDLFGRQGIEFQVQELDETWPRYLLEHRDRYERFIAT